MFFYSNKNGCFCRQSRASGLVVKMLKLYAAMLDVWHDWCQAGVMGAKCGKNMLLCYILRKK